MIHPSIRVPSTLLMIVLAGAPRGTAGPQKQGGQDVLQELQTVFPGLSVTLALLPRKDEYGARFKPEDPAKIASYMKYSGTINLQITADGKISGTYEIEDIQDMPGGKYRARCVASGEFSGEKRLRAYILGKPFLKNAKIAKGWIDLFADGTGTVTRHYEYYSDARKKWEPGVDRQTHKSKVWISFPYSAGQSTWNVGPGPAGPLQGSITVIGDGRPPIGVGARVFSYAPGGEVAPPPPEKAAPEETKPPVPPPAPPSCDADAELGLLEAAIDKVVALESEALNAASELAAQLPAVERARVLITEATDELVQPNESTFFEPPDWTDGRVLAAAERVREFRESHERLCREQDRVIGGITRKYRALAADLQKKAHDLECPDVRKAFIALWTYVGDSWDRAELLMYFESGQHEKLRALAKERLAQRKDEGESNWLLGQDYLKTGESAQALFCFRAVDRILKDLIAGHPPNKVPRELSDLDALIGETLRQLEVGFMETVDRKVLGDAATVRALLEEELDLVEKGGLWDTITTGLAAAYAGFSWREGGSLVEGRARVAGYIMEEAAAQHWGFSLIMRLRAKGHLLSEIKEAGRSTLARWVADGFKGRALTDRQANNMLEVIAQGFKNPDMVRLMSGTLEEFERYKVRPYYSVEQFRRTWAESLTDFATNPLMVFSIFAPFAKLGALGPAAARLLSASKLSNAEAAASETFLQFMGRTFQMPRLLARTTASNTMLGRRVLKILAWNREASLVRKVFVSGLVQTGAVQAATAVGGIPGRIAAEVITGFGVGDLDEAVKVLKASEITESAAAELAQGMRQVLDESAALSQKAGIASHRERLMQLLGELEVKKPVPDAVRSELLRAAQGLDELAGSAAGGVSSDLARAQLDEIDLASRACRSLAEGKFSDARFIVSEIGKSDAMILKSMKTLQEAIPVAEASRPLKATPTPEPNIAGEAGRMGGAAGDAASVPKATAADKAGKHVSMVWAQHDESYKAADDALKEGIIRKDVSAALAHYQRALTEWDEKLEKAAASGDADGVKRALRELRLTIESHAIARDVGEALPHIKPFGAPGGDEVMKEFADPEIAKLRTEITGIFEQVRTQAQAKPSLLDELLPPLRTSAGEQTLDQPRLLTAGGERFLVKDFTGNVAKAKNELVASRLAKKMEIDSPACAMITWSEAGGKQRCVLVQRFVPNASDLGKVDRGTALALKKHVAEDRALAMLLGDHDRRSRNFLVTVDGRVYAIDRGETSLIETLELDWENAAEDEIRRKIVAGLERRHEVYRGLMEESWPIMEAIDKFITPADMEDILGRIDSLKETDFPELLRGVFADGSKEYERVKTTLMTRKGRLRKLLMDVFQMDSRLVPLRPFLPSEPGPYRVIPGSRGHLRDVGPFLEAFLPPWRESTFPDSRSGLFSIGCSSIISSAS